MNTSQLPQFNLLPFELGKTITIPTTIFWGLFALAAVFTAIISLIFIYHWMRFGINHKKMALVTVIYLIGAILMLLFSFSSLSYYQISV